MIPTFALPGDRTPGQFGPISRTPGVRLRFVYTRNSSWAGMPSVIAMIVGIPASAASSTESAAKRAGTNTIAVFAPVSSTASWNVLNTGRPPRLARREPLDHPCRPRPAARAPAEDFDQPRLALRIRQDPLDRRHDRVGLGAAARVEEVRRRAPHLRDHVKRRHHKPRA